MKTIVAVWLLPLFSVYRYIQFYYWSLLLTFILVQSYCVARGAVTIAGAVDAAATIRGCCCADGVWFALVRSEKERKSLNQSKSKHTVIAREKKIVW